MREHDEATLPDQGSLSIGNTDSRPAEATTLTKPNDMNRLDMPSVPTLLVEPNTLLREGLKRILAETPYRLVASAASLDEARRTWSVGGDPFLLIIDAASDHEARCSQIAQLKAEAQFARVVMLVDHYDLKRVLAAYQAGADAYLIKSVSCEVLVKSLDLVMLGEAVYPSAVLNLLREHASGVDEGDTEQEEEGQESPPRGLSVRETVILRCLMEGDSNKLIARKFDITEATVKVHVKAILRKIRAKNRTQAAIWAASHLPSTGRTTARSS
ncbi:MAG TPA: response regulator transcription factor [Microvirga sp.]|nr:response regulator transcription factor [Microvirga sp.]